MLPSVLLVYSRQCVHQRTRLRSEWRIASDMVNIPRCSSILSHVEQTVYRTYRDFINDTGQDVAVQAGPNGPENVRYLAPYTAGISCVTVLGRITTWVSRSARI